MTKAEMGFYKKARTLKTGWMLVAFCFLWTPTIALAQTQSALLLPNLGDDTSLTLGAERHLGDKIAKEIYADSDYVSDPVLDAYVQGVFMPLLQAARERGNVSLEMQETYAWRPLLIRDASINAFALPGAYFGVHLGLLALVDTPDELASVLAHELSHVTQRHIARGMSKQSAQAPWVVASILVAILAARSNSNAAGAVLTGGQAAGIQGQLNFSRDMEREADRVGFTLMQPAGYAPDGFVAMFNKLGAASRFNDNASFPYLRSHPLTSERVADMSNRVGELGALAKQESTRVLSLQAVHRLMSARAAVLVDTRVDALATRVAKAQAANASDPKYLSLLYAGALAAWLHKDKVQAQTLFGLLQTAVQKQEPSNPYVAQVVHWLGAQLQVVTKLNPNSAERAELFYWAQQQTPSNAKLVAERLQNWLAEHPMDADAWDWLASAQQQQGLRIRAIIAQAQAQAARLDGAGALARYSAAQALIRQGVSADPVDAAIVDSKVRTLQVQLKEDKSPPAPQGR